MRATSSISSAPRRCRRSRHAICSCASETHRQLFTDLLAEGRGIILVTGHYGNWEIGSILIRDALQLPLTVVAMTEANPEVNQARREIREALGVETLEVRQSLETALQLRRQLAANRIIAMLVDRHLGRDRVTREVSRTRGVLPSHARAARLHDRRADPAVLHRADRRRPVCGSARNANPSGPGRSARRRDSGGDAGNRGRARRPRARAPRYWYHFYRYWDAQRDSYDGLH